MAIEEHCSPKRILETLPVTALEGDGWERRFITDVDRAAEAVELYSQLGFEVHVETMLASDLGGDCNECALVAACQFKTIYTRTTRCGPQPNREQFKYEHPDRNSEA
jgi:hypothetical protein